MRQIKLNTMKKLALFSALGLAIGFISCTKDHTCSCSFTEPFLGTTITADTMFMDMKKGEAKDLCDDQEVILTLFDPNADCELK